MAAVTLERTADQEVGAKQSRPVRDAWGDLPLEAVPASQPVPVAELLPVVQEVSRLAMALSEASFRQGRLEAQVRHLLGQAEALQRQEQSAGERALRAETEAAELRQQLLAERSKSFWQRLWRR